MKEIINLREKRAKAWETAKAFLELKRNADGTVSAEDSASFDKMADTVEQLSKEIMRLERQQSIDLEMNLPTSSHLFARPGTTEAEAKTGRASTSYKTAFWRMMRQKSLPHEVYNALQVGTESEGGYLVPDEYERTLDSVYTSYARTPAQMAIHRT